MVGVVVVAAAAIALVFAFKPKAIDISSQPHMICAALPPVSRFARRLLADAHGTACVLGDGDAKSASYTGFT